MISGAISLAAAVALAIIVSRFLGLFLVKGESMLPTLQEGEWVLARRYLPWEKPRKGEIVIFLRQASSTVLIKRVLVGPGEMLLEEAPEGEPIPEKHYLLISDNASLSLSARRIGPVDRRRIWGKAWLVVWPCRNLRRTTNRSAGNSPRPTRQK
jgi:signal peptidase I